MKLLAIVLYPFSFIYNVITSVRNFLFNSGVIVSKGFTIPIISIGNLSVGGTGKTPHVEYLVRLLQDKYRLATLSRGYKRITKGYLHAASSVTALELGDEPFQMFRKFPNIAVAVCEKRVEGVERLLENETKPNIILLDDAFQHRYLQVGLSILLTDYTSPYWTDYLLPSGRLRENRMGAKRADVVIVTKCPLQLSDFEKKTIIAKAKLRTNQSIFFTTVEYDELIDFHNSQQLCFDNVNNKKVLLLSGIANPELFRSYVGMKVNEVNFLRFPDHHNFSTEDIENIKKQFAYTKSDIIITTEKDAARLREYNLTDIPVYYLPIRIKFLFDEEEQFSKLILSFINDYKLL